MDRLQPYLNDARVYLVEALDFAHRGFLHVNVVLGLLIAVIAAFMLTSYRLRPVIATTIGATLAFIVAQVLVPVIDHGAAFKLPDIMVANFWREMALLAVGLFITITVFYIVKRTVLPRGGGHH
ncbi:MAG TPA: hypothetical protein VEH07_02340 [Alphaproteobacteria bacterium]|nr:hypothetical protein [Alphaproteobacteria bacterium]